MIIGITGPIGSDKDIVAKMLATVGVNITIAEMRAQLVDYLHLLEDVPMCSLHAAKHVRRIRNVLETKL